MIERIKEISKLTEGMFNAKTGIIGIIADFQCNRISVNVMDLKAFMKYAEDLPVITEVGLRRRLLIARHDLYEIRYHATEEEFKEYKNSRATNTTKESFDTL